VELHGTANVEGAVQHGVGAIEVADAHADLAERRQCNRQAGALAQALVQVHRPLGESQGLLVAVPNQGHVGLIAIYRRKDIVRLQQRGHALRLPKGGVRFVVAAGLREHDRRQRVHHRQVPPIAGRVQGGRRFGNVLAHNRHVADLPIALSQIEVGEANGAGVVRDLGLFQRPVVEGDGPGLLAAGKGDAPVQAPEIRVENMGQGLAYRVRRPADHGSGLCKIPLQEVRFSQHDADTELVLPGQRRRRT